MNCQDAQGAVENLHKNPTNDVIWGNDTKLALAHMTYCDTCKAWFNQAICSFVKGLSTQDFDEIEMLHIMVHDQLEIDYCDAL